MWGSLRRARPSRCPDPIPQTDLNKHTSESISGRLIAQKHQIHSQSIYSPQKFASAMSYAPETEDAHVCQKTLHNFRVSLLASERAGQADGRR